MGRGAAWMVVGIVPVEGVAGEHAAAERPREAHAVQWLRGLWADAGEVEDRRRDIGRDHGHGVCRARLRHARPRHEKRHSDACLVGRALARAERRVVGHVHQPAVVAGEEDGGAVADADRIERIEDPAHRVVDTLHHRGIGGVFAVTVPHVRLVLRGYVWLRLDRRVHAVVREVEEEWLVAVSLDKPHRLGSLAVSEIFPRRAVGERGDLVGREVARWLAPVGAANVLVEALMRRAELVASEVPLADRRCGVAGRLEPFGHRHRLERQVLLPGGNG